MPARRSQLRFMVLTLMCISAVCAPSEAEDVVHLRGGTQTLRGDIQSINDAGVTLVRTGSSAPDATRLISWDRVARVEADTRERRLDEYLPIADSLWRSRSRLERGDALLAEPGFERQFPRYVGQTNETALVVVEGLLRCRIARLANAAVVIPSLELIRLRRAGVSTESYRYLTPVFDGQLNLCPFAPPILVNDGSLRRLERDLIEYDAFGDDHVGALRDVYLYAIRRQLGEDVEFDDGDLPTGVGLRLMAGVIQATTGGERLRAASRSSLTRLVESSPEWAHAWIAIATGRSLLMEAGLAEQLEGMVQLTQLPAMQQHRMHHHLIGIALHDLSAALERIGDKTGAAKMEALLVARYPEHPVLNATID